MLVWSVLSKKSLNSLSKKLDQGRRVNVSVSHSVTVQMIFGAKQLVKLKQKYDHEDSGLCLTISLSNEEIGNKWYEVWNVSIVSTLFDKMNMHPVLRMYHSLPTTWSATLRHKLRRMKRTSIPLSLTPSLVPIKTRFIENSSHELWQQFI